VLKQTLIWTALPHRLEGPVQEGAELRLSAFVSPRLWNDDPTVHEMALNEFPDFLDWPAVMGQASFQVAFAGGPTLTATPDTSALRPDLWQALFKSTTRVVPFVFEDLSRAGILSFSATAIHDVVKSVYQRAATDPGYGAGTNLPGRDRLAGDPDLVEIARPVRARPPFEPDEPDRGPVVLDEPGPEEPPPPRRPGCLGCLPAFLLLPLRLLWALIRRLLRAFGIAVTLPLLTLLGVGGGGSGLSMSGGGGAAPSSAKKAAFDALTTYMAPTDSESQDLPTPSEMDDEYDFHSMVAALGDYPRLLRRMGLVVDLTVTVPAGGLPATGTVRVIPTLTLSSPTAHHTPKTHYELATNRFVARPRVAGADLNAGLLRLQDEARFEIQQVDVVGAGVKLQNTATNLVGLVALNEMPANAGSDDGLPALQTAGIAIVRPDAAADLKAAFVQSYALNAGLAKLDSSPVKPLASGQPAPAPTDEVYAEELVRGYRLDVWDEATKRWLSLCRRVGSYAFLELGPGGEALVEEDEGFVQLSTTEALKPGATQVLRAHETLIAWDGWSLCAPRPGEAITDGDDHAEVGNAAATPFKLETTFEAKKGSLPRLRFGSRYRLRARVADLAGNSVFEPESAPFGETQPEASGELTFRRFEPVAPPTVLLRSEPKEGESLERVTVRSAVNDSEAEVTAQLSERHVAPPKAAQLMAERHGHFDGTPSMLKNAAGYNLASREAGTVTHSLNLVTGDMDLIPGVKQVPDGVATPTFWLQTNESFELSFLPDPYARGVLLMGLPGMPSPDAVTDGVNRLTFDGIWPKLKPLRLRVQGIVAGATPASPDWVAATHQLTVQLPQGETARVRIGSFFNAADLANMGVWGWTEEAAPSDLVDLRNRAIEGRNWLELPFRELVLVHAVQQPLTIPQLTPLSVGPPRQVGETSVWLTGNLAVDGKSTGKVDLWAEWEDPVDDPSDPTNDPTSSKQHQRMHVRELTLPEPVADTPSLADILKATGDTDTALRHTLGDTKYHKVIYTPIASTRFREHFPPAVVADPANLTRPMPTTSPPETALTTSLDVPNAARPHGLRPAYVIPIFRWDETKVGQMRKRERHGGGLRIYVERPWYSSGDGELVGLLVRPPNVAPTGDAADTLSKFVSEWAMDPLWSAAKTAPLALADLLNPTKTTAGLPAAQRPNLAELPAQRVDVAGFKPDYDPSRQLWFADVAMRVEHEYFPFVRLALARYQPISVAGAHLSPAVLSDFVQVVPHRTAEYDFDNVVANGSVRVRLYGPAHAGEGLTRNIVIAILERREHGDTAADEPVGWVADAAIFLASTSTTGFDQSWEGVLQLPDPLPDPLRISVLEMEVHRTDGRQFNLAGLPQMEALQAAMMMPSAANEGMVAGFAGPMVDGMATGFTGSMMDLPDQPDFGFRIVFADATRVEPL
jgi:hypothetical protein